MKKEAVIGILRIFMGWIFLWPFLDKLFGLGFATLPEKAWLLGNSPTYGFLAMAAKGPFASGFNLLAGNVFVDWAFMIGLLLIGVALILGIGVRVAAVSGSLLLFLMWLAVLPPEHNPFLDEHWIYILVLVLLGKLNAGEYLGFGRKWERLKIVRRNKWLK